MPGKTKTSYSADAYRSIKTLIVESKILPNEVITEQALAAQTNIGRTPIREALKRLEQEGLIVTENRRKRVHAFDLNEINQIFELKICIESEMAGLAATRATDQALISIDATMVSMEEQAAQLGEQTQQNVDNKVWFRKWMDLDARLHEGIYRSTGNELSIDLVRSLNVKIHRFKLGMLTLEGRVITSVKEHRTFVDAILARDAERSRATMREHLTNVHQELAKLMKIFNVQ